MVPATGDTITIDVPEFVGGKYGFNKCLVLGSLRLIEFTSLMEDLDKDGRIKEAIRTALNDVPGLRQMIMHAALGQGPRE